MVTGNTDEVKLVLTIDRADLERQLSKGFDASVGKIPAEGRPKDIRPGGGMSPEDWADLKERRAEKSLKRDQAELAGMRGGPTTKDTGAEAGKKPTRVNPGKSFMKVLGPLAALLGIGLTLTAMLKMSQVMQTTASAFRAILGAFVDLFMLMFMPIIVDILRWLVKMLPFIQAWTQKWGPRIVEWIRMAWDVLYNQIWPELKRTYQEIKPILQALGSAIGELVDLLDWVFSKIPGFGPTPRTNKETREIIPPSKGERIFSGLTKFGLAPLMDVLRKLQGAGRGFNYIKGAVDNKEFTVVIEDRTQGGVSATPEGGRRESFSGLSKGGAGAR